MAGFAGPDWCLTGYALRAYDTFILTAGEIFVEIADELVDLRGRSHIIFERWE